MQRDEIALQLWTVRRELANDPEGTLAAVAAAGYRAVELAGLPELPPDRLGALLVASGLRVVASHEGMDRLRNDAAAVTDRLAALDCRQAVVPSMPEEDRRTADCVRRFAAELSALAGTFRRSGIRLGYHNHDFEFRPVDGTTVWEVLLGELSDEVDLEIDIHWLAVGGRDPAEEIRRLAGRVRLLHLKDRTAGPDRRDAPPGEGSLPIVDIVDAGRSSGVAWYIVEQDEPLDALRDVERGLRYLESIATDASGSRSFGSRRPAP